MSIATAFKSFMQWIAGAEKVIYTDIVKYAPPVAKLAEMIFPQFSTAIATGETTVLDATTLIQNAVLMVEQKYAASGVATGTGAQKSAEVLLLTEQAVTSLLTAAGVTGVTTDYIQSVINAVVAILNISGTAPATAAA